MMQRYLIKPSQQFTVLVRTLQYNNRELRDIDDIFAATGTSSWPAAQPDVHTDFTPVGVWQSGCAGRWLPLGGS